MSFFAWTNQFSVNVKEIDDQHKRLVELLNELFVAMRERKGKDVLGNVLTGLIDYTKTHFATEERLMIHHSYPEYSSHKKEHTELTQKVIDLAKDYKNGKITLSIEVGLFLKDWLNNHIIGTDKKLGAFLKSKGVK